MATLPIGNLDIYYGGNTHLWDEATKMNYYLKKTWHWIDEMLPLLIMAFAILFFSLLVIYGRKP